MKNTVQTIRCLVTIGVMVSWTALVSVEVRAQTPASENDKTIYHDGWIDLNKDGRKDIYEDTTQPIPQRIEDLLGRMTTDEKTCQLATLYGYGRVLRDPLPTPEWKNEIWKDGLANIDEMHNGVGRSGRDNPHLASPAATAKALNIVQRWFVEETRLGIPVDFTNEGIRGLCYRRSTNFPANIALGATWNRELATRIGEVVASEARAVGYTDIYAPIMDLARDPRWGRVLSCYGEDPYLVAEIGIRMAKALRAQGLASTAKHFAVYSEPEGGRDGRVRTNPHVAPREMEMLHLWPWERLVREADILGVMSSYNDYDGVPISGSHEFMIDRLRSQWGFRGYVVSDSAAVRFLDNKHRVASSWEEACAMFLIEGGNVRTNFTPPQDFVKAIRQMIEAGKLPISVVDDRVRDVLRVKFLIGLFDHPYVPDPEKADAVVHSADHQTVALEAARQSIVLLKNDKRTLPLSKKLKRILVCGPTAKMEQTSHDRYGSNSGEIISPLEGIEKLLEGSGTEVDYAEGCTITGPDWPESELFPQPPTGEDAKMIVDAISKTTGADAIIVFLGDSNDTIGEAKSRTSLDLPGYQTNLVQELSKTGKPIVVVLLTGRPATINWINRYVPAVVEAWFPGEFGGQAIAEVLFGDVNPGGKLPVTFPRSVGQIPFNFPYKPGSHDTQGREFNPNGYGNSMAEGALYPFGFGLSYTIFEYSDLKIAPETLDANGTVKVTCTIKNTGSRAGDEVVQLYLQDAVSSVTTYDLNLRGFERIRLEPGESKMVTFDVPMQSMALINRADRRVVEPGTFKVFVGESSENIRLKGDFLVK